VNETVGQYGVSQESCRSEVVRFQENWSFLAPNTVKAGLWMESREKWRERKVVSGE
jgi:hypothetical protein